MNKQDSLELRKELQLPLKKELIYLRKINGKWKTYSVIDYEIIDRYQPSNTASLRIYIETGESIRILATYFAQMQKPSFINDMENSISV